MSRQSRSVPPVWPLRRIVKWAALILLGAFLLPAGPRSGATLLLPIGLLIAVAGHPAASLLGLRLVGTRLGAFTPAAGWLLTVLLLASPTTEGDVVIPGSGRSVLYLLVGAFAFVVAGSLPRPTRPASSVARRSGSPVRRR